MASWRRLKGIAIGLLSTFVSRNNDIGGYWGIGKLRAYADKDGDNSVTIDLLQPDRPSFLSEVFGGTTPTYLAEIFYRNWLVKTAPKFGVRFLDIAEAKVSIKFTTFEELPDVTRNTRGLPYICRVTLTSKNGSTYSATEVGVCEPHNPRNESKRADY